jgi:hypothetical protein
LNFFRNPILLEKPKSVSLQPRFNAFEVDNDRAEAFGRELLNYIINRRHLYRYKPNRVLYVAGRLIL